MRRRETLVVVGLLLVNFAVLAATIVVIVLVLRALGVIG